MSKFDYKAEGKLNSKYLFDLLNDYLDKILTANDAKGIAENDYKINPTASRMSQKFNHTFKRIGMAFNKGVSQENYNKVLTTEYAQAIKDKLQIHAETSVLDAKTYFDLKQTLKAIKFDLVLPELEENRVKAMRKSERKLLKILGDIDYLKCATIDYILFNPPVEDIKPFLSDKVTTHAVNINEIKTLVKHYNNKHYQELVNDDFEPEEIKFTVKKEDFYNEQITDKGGVGEEVEQFIRSKIDEKLDIMGEEEILIEDRKARVAEIDLLLKRLKLHKIEAMTHKLVELKTNQAQAKEVVDKCKEIINSSMITNKSGIFLLMDNLYYKLSKKCDKLQETLKSKIQLIDKQKMYAMLEQFQTKSTQTIDKTPQDALHLYDEDETDEMHISEDADDEAEDEVVIEE